MCSVIGGIGAMCSSSGKRKDEGRGPGYTLARWADVQRWIAALLMGYVKVVYVICIKKNEANDA